MSVESLVNCIRPELDIFERKQALSILTHMVENDSYPVRLFIESDGPYGPSQMILENGEWFYLVRSNFFDKEIEIQKQSTALLYQLARKSLYSFMEISNNIGMTLRDRISKSEDRELVEQSKRLLEKIEPMMI